VATDRVLVDVGDRIATVTLNRPDKLNAIDEPMWDALLTALETLGQDDSVRVIRLKGAGRAFSSGADIEAGEDSARFHGNDALAMSKLVNRHYGRQWNATWNNPKPIVAQVHGYCVAFALELLGGCDLVVAARETQFGLTVSRFGAVMLALLPWTVGIRKARELILTPRTIDAETALRCGLVNHVVELEDLDSAAMDLCRDVAAVPPEVTYFGKMAINRSLEQTGIGGAVHRSGWDAYVMTSQTAGISRQWNEIRQREGLAAALRWVNEPFGRDPAKGETAAGATVTSTDSQ
jgi:enoyl-CoA hydratase/carnithine racemase